MSLTLKKGGLWYFNEAISSKHLRGIVYQCLLPTTKEKDVGLALFDKKRNFMINIMLPPFFYPCRRRFLKYSNMVDEN